MYRSLTIRRWSPNVEGFFFSLPPHAVSGGHLFLLAPNSFSFFYVKGRGQAQGAGCREQGSAGQRAGAGRQQQCEAIRAAHSRCITLLLVWDVLHVADVPRRFCHFLQHVVEGLLGTKFNVQRPSLRCEAVSSEQFDEV